MELTKAGWEDEHLYHDADTYFQDLLLAIAEAREEIILESFIFDADVLGLKVCHALVEAALRGVRVRLLVDGIGAAHWPRSFSPLVKNTPLEVRLFHPLPWHLPKGMKLSSYFLGLGWINKRNHRKACVIDKKLAFVGSYNITIDHLQEFGPRPAWRDSGIRIQGPQVRDIILAFERAWSSFPLGKRLPNFKRHQGLVRLNNSPRLRHLYFKDLCLRLKYARDKIWITNPYFIPDRKFIQLLCEAAARGVDVRVILPDVSDLLLFPWINSLSSRTLLRHGVRVYHYKSRVLHAKTVIIDDWSMLGSSNLNSRSLLHDLEMDIVTYSRKAHGQMLEQFLADQSNSELQIYERLIQKYWTKNIFFPLLRLIRYWI